MKNIGDITIHMSSVMQGMMIQMITRQKAPDKFRSVVKMGDNLVQEQVFDGNKGRISGMQGTMEMEGEMLDKMKTQAIINPELTYEERGYTLELDGVENVAGKVAFRVRITSPQDHTITEFFDSETFLKLRTVIVQDTPMGEVTQITDYDDYKRVYGMLFPFKMKQQAGPQSIDIQINAIEINTGIDDEVFRVN